MTAEDRQAAQVVEMHHFCGLSHETVAVSLFLFLWSLTVYRVRQKWTHAQAWPRNDLKSRPRNFAFFFDSSLRGCRMEL